MRFVTFSNTLENVTKRMMIFIEKWPDYFAILGKAGMLTLWHAWMIHEGSANVRDSPRFAVFARYAHRSMRSPERWVPTPVNNRNISTIQT